MPDFISAPSAERPGPPQSTASSDTDTHSSSKVDGKRGSQRRKRSSKSNGASTSRGSGTTRELLSTNQKQANHRNAETRRRQEITERLTIICDEIVPNAKGLAKSTEMAYTKAHEYLREMLLEKKTMVEQIQALGGEVPASELEAIEALKAYDEISSDESTDKEDTQEGQNGWDDSDGEDDDENDSSDDNGDENEDAVFAAESLHQMKMKTGH